MFPLRSPSSRSTLSNELSRCDPISSESKKRKEDIKKDYHVRFIRHPHKPSNLERGNNASRGCAFFEAVHMTLVAWHPQTKPVPRFFCSSSFDDCLGWSKCCTVINIWCNRWAKQCCTLLASQDAIKMHRYRDAIREPENFGESQSLSSSDRTT